MFSKILISKSTGNFSDNIKKLKSETENAETIVIGAGAGLSASAGFAYDGERFERYFSDFHEKYGITDMYSGGFYPFETQEESWAWWSRQIMVNRYDCPVGKPYSDLLKLVKDKDYFVLTTNVDHQFQRAGFDKKRLFYTQGDYGLFQCSGPCRQETFDNEAAVREMVRRQEGLRVLTELLPVCPHCGRPMTMNLRCDDTFVQDEGWYQAAERYSEFLRQHRGSKLLFLDLGTGMNTPAIIKFPFWRMVGQQPDAIYACINLDDAYAPDEIRARSICIQADIGSALAQLGAAHSAPEPSLVL